MTKVKRICQFCGKEFEIYPSKIKDGRGIFCSRECLYKSQKTQIKQRCKYCDNIFKVRLYKTKGNHNLFCSRKCWYKWKSKNIKGKNHPQWKGGISFEPYCPKFNNEFREYIRNKFGRVCFLCSITEEENGKRLSVHHVNYNKNCGCDGDKTCQFVPLCVSCNSKVNSNRKMWEAEIKNKMRNKLNGWII